MPQVIDRTRPARFRKGVRQALRYEVVIYHREVDFDDNTGVVLAKFAYNGDAQSWARGITDNCYCIVVRN